MNTRNTLTTLTLGAALAAPALLTGCGNKYVAPEDSDTGYVYQDTQQVQDSETGDSTVDTADTDTSDTHDTVETGETGDTASDLHTALDVYPSNIAVGVGAVWTERAVSTAADGLRADAVGVAWSTDDAAVASVDAAGTITANAVGSTTLHAVLDGLDTPVTVTVTDDNLLSVTVYDAATGLPIPDAKVKTTAGSARTDATGTASVPVTDGGPATVTSYVDDSYGAVTYVAVSARAVTVYLEPKDSTGTDADLQGTVDLSSSEPPDWNEVGVGIVVPSLNRALALLTVDDLFGADRDVTVFGITVGLPSNLVVQGTEESYLVDCWPGAVGNWGFSGPLKVSDVSSGITNTADALALLIANLGTMTWGYNTGAIGVGDAAATLDLVPALGFTDSLSVALPALSVGFHGDEQYLVFAADEHVDDGWMVTGISTGTSSAMVQTVPSGSVLDSIGSGIMALAQVGGIGTGGATSATFGSVAADGSVTLPPLQDVAVIDAWDPATATVGVTTDADADFVRVRFTDTRHHIHDLFLAPGTWTGTLPNAVSGFGNAAATIEVSATQTVDGAFEDWLISGAVDMGQMSVLTSARTLQD